LARHNPNEYKLGIVFSKLECTGPCHIIAQKSFDKQNIYLVNFSMKELEEIIYKRLNFLDYLAMKMDELEHGLVLTDKVKDAYLQQ